MLRSDFQKSARYIAARNLTPNVAAVAASWNETARHAHVTYFLYGPVTDDDVEWRELTVGELVADFPAIQTASSAFGSVASLNVAEQEDLVFERT